MTEAGGRRAHLRGLVDRLGTGAAEPKDVFAEARELWLSGGWPSQHDENYDAIASDVLFLLADARLMGVSHEDAPVLLAYLDGGSDGADSTVQRLYEQLALIDPAKREAL